MKRYSFLLILVVFTVLGIGGFYVRAAFDRLPEFTLVGQFGDEQEAADVQLYGWFKQSLGETPVMIGQKGSKYASEQSIFQQLKAQYWDNGEMERLVKEHRSFMRGKTDPSSIFEDDYLLVHVAVQSSTDVSRGMDGHVYQFEVSIQRKSQSKSVTTYRTVIPDGQLYRWINIKDVQVAGNTIYVFTDNIRKTDGQSEFHLYEFSLTDTDGHSIQDHRIHFSSLEEEAIVPNSIQFVTETDRTRARRYLILRADRTLSSNTGNPLSSEPTNHTMNSGDEKNIATVGASESADTAEAIATVLLIYDLQSGRDIKNFPQEVSAMLDHTNQTNITSEGDRLFLIHNEEDIMTIVQYNIPDAQVTSYTLPIPSPASVRINNNRLYVLNNDTPGQTSQTKLFIADLDTGRPLYQGTVSLSGADASPGTETLTDALPETDALLDAKKLSEVNQDAWSRLTIYQIFVK